MGKTLSEDEVQRALDFCVNIFSPTTPEQHEIVKRKILESQWVPDEHDEHTDADKADDGAEPSPSTHTASDVGAPTEDAAAKTADRLLDIRGPIMDPSALTNMLKSRLSIFTRTKSSGSVKSVHSIGSASVSSISNASPPASPVSAVFSSTSMSNVSDSSFGEDGSEGGDSEVKMVLEKVNARRVIHADMSMGVHSLEQEAVDGMLIRLKRGELGLIRAN